MDAVPRYTFLSLVVLVFGGLLTMHFFHQKSDPPEPA